MATLLFTLAATVQVGVALWAVLGALREQASLRRWVDASKDPEAAQAAAKDLPEPHRGIAQQMAESVRVRSTLDDALVKAVVRAGEETWAPPAIVQAFLHGSTVLLALAPACYALLELSTGVGAIVEQLARSAASARYLEAPALLEGPFAGLRAGFADTALLLAGLAVVWSLSWWLRRPQAREARLVQSVLRVATQIRPGTPAPVGGRLAALVAPERDLARPVAATGLWLGAVTLGWGILYLTSEVRADNQREMTYAVWPAEGRAPINVGPDLGPPHTRGGQPLEDEGRLTISLSPMQVLFQGRPLARIEEGRLAGPLPEPDPTIQDRLKEAPGITVLADARLDVQDGLRPVLAWLGEEAGVELFHLLVLRDLPSGLAQADLPLATPSDAAPGVVMRIAPDATTVGTVRVPTARPTHRRDVRAAVRQVEALFAPGGDARVRVEVAEGVTYGDLTEALGAADDACPADADCGLPGLGLRFELAP